MIEIDEDKLWFCERKGYHETYKSWTKDEIKEFVKTGLWTQEEADAHD